MSRIQMRCSPGGLLFKDGATGEYEDSVPGIVLSDSEVWGRPVGVATTASPDASGRRMPCG